MSKPASPSEPNDSPPTAHLPEKDVCWTLLLREQDEIQPEGSTACSSKQSKSSKQSEPATDVVAAFRLGGQLFRELAEDAEPEPEKKSGSA